MDNNESRDEQYLRILTTGLRDESDYEAAKYLKDKGYAKVKYRLSKGLGTHGKVIDIVWMDYTSNGLDLIDELKARIKTDKPQIIKNTERNEESNTIQNSVIKWHETAPGKITIGIIIAVIALITRKHFF